MIASGGQPPVKRWSFSAIIDFESCPYRTFLKRVEKLPEPPRDDSHPAARGDRIHKAAEDFIKGEGPLVKELEKVEDIVRARAEVYSSGTIQLEQKWGYDKEWGRRSWSDDLCWGMIKCDLVEHRNGGQVVEVDDWKTGKRFGNEVKHQQQMQLYAIGVFMRYPKCDIAKARLVYTDEGKTMEKTYDRSMIPQILPRWQIRAEKLTNAMVFRPIPNKSNCRFCPYGTQNGTGACAYAAGAG